MECPDESAEHGCPADLGPGDHQNISHQHILQMLGFTDRFAHRQDGTGGGDGIGNADDGLLRNLPAPALQGGENYSAEKREDQADGIGSLAVHIHAEQHCHGGAQRGNLGQGNIHKYDAPFHHMDSKIGKDSGVDQAGYEWNDQKR